MLPLFQNAKVSISEFTGLPYDALHVHIGLIIFFGTWLVWRWRGSVAVAWFVTLSITLLGELFDSLSVSTADVNPAHWHDIWNTMLWPTAILLLWRLLPKRAAALADQSQQPLE